VTIPISARAVVVKLKNEKLKFYSAFGERLTRLGFSAKVVKRTNFFQQETEAGMVGIHVNPVYREDGIDIILSGAASISAVQEILVQTELYAWDGGLTWTFGIGLRQVREKLEKIPPIPMKYMPDGSARFRNEDVWAHIDKYGTYEAFVPAGADDSVIDAQADLAFERVRKYGWPLLLAHGMTESTALELMLRTDEIAELCFLEPNKALAGLILARKLDNPRAKSVILKNARKKFAMYRANGNPDISDKFEKIASEFDLI
jgi:hypothetical protein